MAKDLSKKLGGMSGKAGKALRGRAAQLAAAEAEATGSKKKKAKKKTY